MDDVVDYFIICESKYDHRGNAKSINFFLKNKKFQNKIRHIVLEENFPNLQDPWEIESYQREMIFKGLYDSDPSDLIMYSDSDEIPNPEILKNYSLNKKFGIFMMKSYVYKLNIFEDSRETWTETSLSAFVRINPIYILVPNSDEKFINLIKKQIAKKIKLLGIYGDDSVDFRIGKKNFQYDYDERKIIVPNNIDSIIEVLKTNPFVIYQRSTGKYWQRFYID